MKFLPYMFAFMLLAACKGGVVEAEPEYVLADSLPCNVECRKDATCKMVLSSRHAIGARFTYPDGNAVLEVDISLIDDSARLMDAINRRYNMYDRRTDTCEWAGSWKHNDNGVITFLVEVPEGPYPVLFISTDSASFLASGSIKVRTRLDSIDTIPYRRYLRDITHLIAHLTPP